MAGTSMAVVAVALALEHVLFQWALAGPLYLLVVSVLSLGAVWNMWRGAGNERARKVVASLWTLITLLYHVMLVNGPG